MKSFLLVRSQSQISTDNRLSLSASFSWLEESKEGMVLFWKPLRCHRAPPHSTRTWMQIEEMLFKDRSSSLIFNFPTSSVSKGECRAAALKRSALIRGQGRGLRISESRL